MRELRWIEIFPLKIVCIFLLEKKKTFLNSFSVSLLKESYFAGEKETGSSFSL